MREKEKNSFLKIIIILGIIFNVFLFNILPLYYLTQYEDIYPPPPRFSLKFGMKYIAEDIDPQYCRSSACFDAICMVWEGLIAANLSHPEMPLYPLLATDLGTYNPTRTELTFNLKQGVRFHDGTDFNADAVIFSFERLAFLMNITGELPGDCFYQKPTILHSLYEWPDGTPIINHTEKLNNYKVKFVLNKPYGPFRRLLSFSGSAILSPNSTPEFDYIKPASISQVPDEGPLGYGVAIGTGPMRIEILNIYEVRFSEFGGYHQSRIGFSILVHVKIEDDGSRNMAVLSGAVDIITDPHPTYLDEMKAEEGLILYEAGFEAIVQYIGFNNKLYNKTWRKAISWALDYKYMIIELLEEKAVRLNSPIPLGILFANWSFNIPILNLSKARQYLNQMGYGIGFTSDAEWKAVATSETPFLKLNYTYNLNNKFRKEMSLLIQNNLSMIGIKVIDAGIAWEEYKDRILNRRNYSAGWDALQLFWIEWWPDFNDPSDYINSLMSNTSTFNSAQINDLILEDYILEGLQETNQSKRAQIYWDLQKYLVEELCPCIFCYIEKNYDVWNKDLYGYPSNAMEIAYFYPCY